MKEKRKRAALPVSLALTGLVLLGLGELAMWRLSGYGPLLALAMLQMVPGLVNSLLLLPLGKESQREERPLPEAKWKAVLVKLGRWFVRAAQSMGDFWCKKWSVLVGILLLAVIFAGNCIFWPGALTPTGTAGLAFWMPVALALAFVVSIVLEKLCAHAAGQEHTGARRAAILRNLRGAMALGRIGQVLTAAAMVLTLVELYDPQLILQIALLILFLYETVLLVLSIAIRLIRRELSSAPELPLSVKAMGSSGVISYLEENTGITMRSLWSIRLIRQILPIMAVFILLLCWVSSGIVQIDAHQEGALYRLGKLQAETLKPGIHMTLPWPFDKVEVHNTQSPRKVVIGYVSNGGEDNTWTDGHAEEYRFLLGGGNEIVSINLQVEYRISDLSRFLRSSASAESLLSAAAYEIVTDQTISTDIDSFLSVDRTKFSENFLKELEERLAGYELGIQVTNVVLESIHPPVEVAWIYQEVISAGIRAKKYILEAERSANMKISWSYKEAEAEVSSATTAHHRAVAAAEESVASFMAALEACENEPSAYRYYKYMNALTQAYQKGVLILVGDGVDSASLIIGDLERPKELMPGYLDENYEEEYWEE